MPTWNPLRSPDEFPMVWHSALLAPPGRHNLGVVRTYSDISRMRYRFSAFKASLREHPGHPTAKGLARLETRIFSEPYGDRFMVKVETKWAKSFMTKLTGTTTIFPGSTSS